MLSTFPARLICLAAALFTEPARAVVGGAPDEGPLAKGSAMVLGSNGAMCSAVVVAPDALLTAAHCVTGAAEHRVHWKGADGRPVLIAPAAKAVHPGYDAKAVEARRPSVDLALLRTPEPLPFPSAALSSAEPRAGESLMLGGWGLAREGDPRSTGTFRAVELTVVEPYGRSRILVWARGSDRAGACQGDSGGPIAQGGRVVAVSSWAAGPRGGSGCGGVSQGVRLGPQRGWIDGVLSGWGREARWE